MLSDGYDKEEGFWHVVSRKDRESEERLPDYRRAEQFAKGNELEKAIRENLKGIGYEF